MEKLLVYKIQRPFWVFFGSKHENYTCRLKTTLEISVACGVQNDRVHHHVPHFGQVFLCLAAQLVYGDYVVNNEYSEYIHNIVILYNDSL